MSVTLPLWEALRREVECQGGEEVARICRRWQVGLRAGEEFRLRVQLRHALKASSAASNIPASRPDVDYLLTLAAAPVRGIRLAEFEVVPGYGTAHPLLATEILALKDAVSIHLDSTAVVQPFSAIVCARSGLGKTQLAKSLADTLGAKVDFFRMDVTDHASNRDAVLEWVDRIRDVLANGRRPFAFLDEVDCGIDGDHCYRHLLPCLEDSTLAGSAMFFAGSAAEDIQSFKTYLLGLPEDSMGKDFLGRVTSRLSFPADLLSFPTERVIRALTVAKKLDPALDAVDGETICYFALTSWESSRAIRHAVERALIHQPKGKTIFSVQGSIGARALENVLRVDDVLAGRFSGLVVKIRDQ